MVPKCCEMKGFLTFLVLWIIRKQPGNGQEIAREIEKRKGTKPSPGTIYPVLKSLRESDLVKKEKGKYVLTAGGQDELDSACAEFRDIFYDHEEICKCNSIN